jgi:DNA-binding MarR family transcriptional regulator
VAANKAKAENRAAKSSGYPCLCAVIRKAGRILTRQYGHYLEPSGLKITQFSMLANIARNPGIIVTELAKLMVMDQTTVSRNLQILEKAGYISLESESTDHRIKKVRIADAGISKMDEARPFWEEAQAEMERVLGQEGIEELLAGLAKIQG